MLSSRFFWIRARVTSSCLSRECALSYIGRTHIECVLSLQPSCQRGFGVRFTDLNLAECEILLLRHPDWLLFSMSCLIFINSWFCCTLHLPLFREGKHSLPTRYLIKICGARSSYQTRCQWNKLKLKITAVLSGSGFDPPIWSAKSCHYAILTGCCFQYTKFILFYIYKQLILLYTTYTCYWNFEKLFNNVKKF